MNGVFEQPLRKNFVSLKRQPHQMKTKINCDFHEW